MWSSLYRSTRASKRGSSLKSFFQSWFDLHSTAYRIQSSISSWNDSFFASFRSSFGRRWRISFMDRPIKIFQKSIRTCSFVLCQSRGLFFSLSGFFGLSTMVWLKMIIYLLYFTKWFVNYLSMLPYQLSIYLEECVWNNAFSYNERLNKRLYIPALIDGNFSDVIVGDNIVFSDKDDAGDLRECVGLQNFISTAWQDTPVIVFDNHNHAAYFWYRAWKEGYISFWTEVIHIDEHSDLWENTNDVDILNVNDWEVADFVNQKCNVWNYIVPFIRNGFIRNFYRIEGEYDMEKYEKYTGNKDSTCILNLDLDFFAPELDYIDYRYKVSYIQEKAKLADFITVATSPFFIEQKRAIQALHDIFIT